MPEGTIGQVLPNNGSLRIGTRGSALARRQTDRVVELLQEHYPGLACEVQIVSTTGDRDKETSLRIIGGRGIFAKELQSALLSGEIDIAVHSVKDLTSVLPEGLMLATIFERVDSRDVVISQQGNLDQIGEGSTVGTSSRRRMALIKRLRPDLEIADLRGNIDTRIRRVTEGALDAAILAAAGVDRMGWTDHVTQRLDIEQFVPSPGQGALGIEVREDNHAVRELLAPLYDGETTLAVEAERTFLRAVGGGCTSPIGAHAIVNDGQATFTGMLAKEDLSEMCIDTRTCAPGDLDDVANDMARQMLDDLSMEVRHRQ